MRGTTILIFGVLLTIVSLPPMVHSAVLCEYQGPDLSDDLLQLRDFKVEGPLSPQVGDTLTVSFNLKNFGQFDISFAEKGVFAAARDPDHDNRSLGSMQGGEIISPGQGVAFQDDLQLNKPGPWYIWPSYQIWVNGAVGRHRKEGPADWHPCILQVGAPQLPDLTPTSMSLAPEEPVVGETASVSVTIRNNGMVASGTCQGILTIGNFLAQAEVPSLGSAENRTVTLKWTPTHEGLNEMRFQVDFKGEIDEIDEENNGIGLTVNVLGRSDLRTSVITVQPPSPVVGSTAVVRAWVENTGGTTSRSCKGALLIDGSIKGTFRIPSLPPGEDFMAELNWTPDAAGSYLLNFTVDIGHSIEEDDETNNYAVQSADVSSGELPDLVATGVRWTPETITEGRSVGLKPLIRNDGLVASRECVVEFYRDGDKVGSARIPPIRAGMSLAEITEISMPWTPDATGHYTISFMVDVDEEVTESNETNNGAEVDVTVFSTDSTPPNVRIGCLPISLWEPIPTERDTPTFRAIAEDDSGIAWIKIFVNGMVVQECRNSTSCQYTGGPYPRRSTVHYAAQAADGANNINLTPWYNFTVRSYYPEFLRLGIDIDPVAPTEIDRVNFTATASYPYGIRVLRIFRNGIKVGEVEDSTSLSVLGGPWVQGHTVEYYAEAYSIDGHHATTPPRSFTVRALGRENIKNMSSYLAREVFLIPDLDWRAVLSLVPIAVWREDDGSITKFPALIYHHENNTAFDADSVIRFLQQYAEEVTTTSDLRVTILGTPPPELRRLLVSPPPLGAGLREDQIRLWRGMYGGLVGTVIELGVSLEVMPGVSPVDVSTFRSALSSKWGVLTDLSPDGSSGIVPMDDIMTLEEERDLREEYWSSIDLYVLCEDRYSTGLMASVFASYFNAPIIFKGHYDLTELDHKSVYLVGDFNEEDVRRLEEGNVRILYRFTREELERHYAIAARTNKVILVNPLDLWTHHRTEYWTEKAPDPVEYLFGKHSLAAPFLAAAKKEVIIPATTYNYVEIDSFVKHRMDSLPLSGPQRLLTIISSPETIPIARPNFAFPPALNDNDVFYQGFAYNDVDIVSNNHRGDRETYVTTDPRQQFAPACSNEVLAWVDEATYGDIWYRDPLTGTSRRVTSDGAAQTRPAVDEEKIVWQDFRHTYVVGGEVRHQWEIYLKELGGSTRRITNSNANQERPAIWGHNVVWQDNRNGNWDIYRNDLRDGTELQITSDPSDQLWPSVYMNKIIYADNRNGNWDIYMSWTGLGGHGVAGETSITTDPSTQWYPRIHSNRIVWQDNRNGNWDIYMWDLDTDTEHALTREAMDQVLPVVWGDKVAWYERDDDGWWYVCLYDIPTGARDRIHRTGISADDGAWWLELDGRYYGSTENLGHQDVATGRIYGITVSDASSYIARDLFFDRIPRGRKALVVVREDHQAEIGGGWKDEVVLENYARGHYWTTGVRGEFTTEYFYSGHNEVAANVNTIYGRYPLCDLLIFVDHGWTGGFADMMDSRWLSSNQIYLQPATVLDLACLTGSYNGEPYKPLLFAAQNIRRGAMVFMGATDVSYWHNMFDDILQAVYIEEKTIGEAYLEARNEDYDDDVWNFSLTLKGDIFYALLGDPTLVPKWW